jgi:alpha-beta hydrolase superfamily lysophospholipase
LFTYDEGDLRSADGTKLFYRRWSAPEPRALLLFVHGVGEHSGRYIHVAEHFAALGFSCFAHDCRGSGHSEGPRGVIQRYSEYLDDLDALVECAREQYPSNKVFLVGHSQGGTIALAYALDHPDRMEGIIASAPALGVHLDDLPTWKVWLAKIAPIIGRALPGLSVNNGIIPEYLSHDPAVARAYTSDPLVHDRAVMCWYVEYVRTQADILTRAPELQTPCLIMQGTADRLAPLQQTKVFYDRLTSPDTKMITYDGYYHEILNEVEKERVFKDMGDWLESRLS